MSNLYPRYPGLLQFSMETIILLCDGLFAAYVNYKIDCFFVILYLNLSILMPS